MPGSVHSKLNHTQVLIPVSHVGRHKVTQDILDNLVGSFSLSISLRVTSSGKFPLDTQARGQGLIEVTVKLGLLSEMTAKASP